MLALFRNATFTRLFVATFASHLGTVVGNMAFAYYLVDRFSSRPALATIAELMYSLPTLVVFWMVGVIADRLDRKHIAAYSDWIRAGLTIPLLIVVHYDLLAACFFILFLRSAISKFFGPAEMGLLQGSINEQQYVQASGLNQMLMGIFMLFGLSLGAAAYHLVGIEGAMIIDGVSFILSGLLISTGKFPDKARMPSGSSSLRAISISLIFRDFKQGLLYIKNNRLLLVLVSGFLLFGIINGVFAVLPIFTMKYKLSPDNYVFYSSLITIFLGSGFLVGSMLSSLMIQRFSRIKVLVTGLFLSSILLVVMGSTTHIEVYFPIVLVAGICIAPVNIAIGSWMPELVIPQNMGKVNALIEPIMMIGHSLALGVIALTFPVFLSISWLHYLLALCSVAVSIYYFIVLPPLVHERYKNKVKSNAASSSGDT